MTGLNEKLVLEHYPWEDKYLFGFVSLPNISIIYTLWPSSFLPNEDQPGHVTSPCWRVHLLTISRGKRKKHMVIAFFLYCSEESEQVVIMLIKLYSLHTTEKKRYHNLLYCVSLYPVLQIVFGSFKPKKNNNNNMYIL